jgi:hypothetical protein
VPLLAILGFVLVSCLFPVGVSYLVDRHLHEGVAMFKRRRVLRQGIEASAKVLSRNVKMTAVNLRQRTAYSLVYEVSPPGEAPFRAKGVEIMYFMETKDNELREGSTVKVKYDPADKTVVLVRVDSKQLFRDRQAAVKAREEALLKGRDDGRT